MGVLTADYGRARRHWSSSRNNPSVQLALFEDGAIR